LQSKNLSKFIKDYQNFKNYKIFFLKYHEFQKVEIAEIQIIDKKILQKQVFCHRSNNIKNDFNLDV